MKCQALQKDSLFLQCTRRECTSIQAIRFLLKLTSWPAVSRTVKKEKQILNCKFNQCKNFSNKMGAKKISIIENSQNYLWSKIVNPTYKFPHCSLYISTISASESLRQMLTVCTSCETSKNVLSYTHALTVPNSPRL